MNFREFALVLATCLSMAAGYSSAMAQESDAKMEKFLKQYLDEHFQLKPTDATEIGDHRFDALLDDISPAAREKWVEHARKTLKELPKQVDYASLSRDDQVDYEIFKHHLETAIWLAENRKPFEEDPRTYVGYINDSVYLLMTRSTLPLDTNVENAMKRMAKIPQIIAAAKQSLKNPPKVILETAIRQNQGMINFYEKDLFEFAGKTTYLDALKKSAATVVSQLKEYQKFLEGDVMPRATGEWRLGKDKFSRQLDLTLDAGMTPDQVYADAEKEFERVRNELYVISRQLWSHYFPKKILPPDDVEGRGLTIGKVIYAVSQEHGAADKLVTDSRQTVDRIKMFIRENDILRLPEPDRCQVIEMPKFKRGNAVAYLDSAPPLDPQSGSFYAISPPDSDWDKQRVETFMQEYNPRMLQILTIHEAYPGHYVQLEYANRTPSMVRKIFHSGPYVEGWAVYTEQMMLDQGYGDGDLRLRLMQLKFYLRAVANAIITHRMHCLNATDEEIENFLIGDAFQSEAEARGKIVRTKQSSTQLSTYFVGRMAMYRLRQQIERELGDEFNLGRYHEAVISIGSVPVKYLPELVRTRLKQPR
jgi:uncharacterized protein (DUF885 family)